MMQSVIVFVFVCISCVCGQSVSCVEPVPEDVTSVAEKLNLTTALVCMPTSEFPTKTVGNVTMLYHEKVIEVWAPEEPWQQKADNNLPTFASWCSAERLNLTQAGNEEEWGEMATYKQGSSVLWSLRPDNTESQGGMFDSRSGEQRPSSLSALNVLLAGNSASRPLDAELRPLLSFTLTATATTMEEGGENNTLRAVALPQDSKSIILHVTNVPEPPRLLRNLDSYDRSKWIVGSLPNDPEPAHDPIVRLPDNGVLSTEIAADYKASYNLEVIVGLVRGVRVSATITAVDEDVDDTIILSLQPPNMTLYRECTTYPCPGLTGSRYFHDNPVLEPTTKDLDILADALTVKSSHASLPSGGALVSASVQVAADVFPDVLAGQSKDDPARVKLPSGDVGRRIFGDLVAIDSTGLESRVLLNFTIVPFPSNDEIKLSRVSLEDTHGTNQSVSYTEIGVIACSDAEWEVEVPLPIWFSLSPIRGTGTALLRAVFNSSTLSSTTLSHALAVAITKPGTACRDSSSTGVSLQTATVQLTKIAPRLVVSPTSTVRTLALRGSNESALSTVTILNDGDAALDWEASLQNTGSWGVIQGATSGTLTGRSAATLVLSATAGADATEDLSGVVLIQSSDPTKKSLTLDWFVQVGWSSVCPEAITVAAAPAEVAPATLSLSNLSPHPLSTAIPPITYVEDMTTTPPTRHPIDVDSKFLSVSFADPRATSLPSRPPLDVVFEMRHAAEGAPLPPGSYAATLEVYVWRQTKAELDALNGATDPTSLATSCHWAVTAGTSPSILSCLQSIGVEVFETRDVQVTIVVERGETNAARSELIPLLNSPWPPAPESDVSDPLAAIAIAADSKAGEYAAQPREIPTQLQGAQPARLLVQLRDGARNPGELRRSDGARLRVQGLPLDGGEEPVVSLTLEQQPSLVGGLWLVNIQPNRVGSTQVSILLGNEPITGRSLRILVQPAECDSERGAIRDADTSIHCVCNRQREPNGIGSCSICPPGSNKRTVGNSTACTTCAEGSYSLGLLTSCQLCPGRRDRAPCVQGRISISQDTWIEDPILRLKLKRASIPSLQPPTCSLLEDARKAGKGSWEWKNATQHLATQVVIRSQDYARAQASEDAVEESTKLPLTPPLTIARNALSLALAHFQNSSHSDPFDEACPASSPGQSSSFCCRATLFATDLGLLDEELLHRTLSSPTLPPLWPLLIPNTLWECPVPGACVQHGENEAGAASSTSSNSSTSNSKITVHKSFRTRCGAEYHGPLCALCAKGFASSSGNAGEPCVKCWPLAVSWMMSIIVISIIIAGTVFLATRQTAKKDSIGKARTAATRVMLNFLQSVGVLASFAAFNAHPTLSAMLASGDLAAGIPLGIFPLQCAFGLTFLDRVYIALLLPIAALLLPPIVAAIVTIAQLRGFCGGEARKRRILADRAATAASTRLQSTRSTTEMLLEGDTDEATWKSSGPQTAGDVLQSNPLAHTSPKSKTSPPRVDKSYGTITNPSESRRQEQREGDGKKGSEEEDGKVDDVEGSGSGAGAASGVRRSGRRRRGVLATVHAPSIRVFSEEAVAASVAPWTQKLLQDNVNTGFRASVVALFLVYFGTARTLLQVFSQLKDHIYGTGRLVADPSVIVGSKEWNIAAGLAGAGIVVYGVGAPVFAVWLLCRVRNKLDDATVMSRWGFLYSGFSLHRDYRFIFEAAILLRKLALAAVSALISTELQPFAAIVILIACTVLHTLAKPFEHPTVNRLETFSLSSQTVAVVAAQAALTKPDFAWLGLVILVLAFGGIFFTVVSLFRSEKGATFDWEGIRKRLPNLTFPHPRSSPPPGTFTRTPESTQRGMELASVYRSKK